MLWIWKTEKHWCSGVETACLKALLGTSYRKYWCKKLLNPTECQSPRSPWWRGCLAGPRRWCCPCCRQCRWWQWTGCSTARTSACSACPSCCCCSNTPLRSSTVFLLLIGSGNIFEGLDHQLFSVVLSFLSLYWLISLNKLSGCSCLHQVVFHNITWNVLFIIYIYYFIQLCIPCNHVCKT